MDVQSEIWSCLMEKYDTALLTIFDTLSEFYERGLYKFDV